MPKLTRVVGIAGALLIAATSAGSVFASSHREAPLTASDPAIDSTDLYAFVSPNDPSKVTIIANYIPMEDPAGGPNFWRFDPNARYELNVDNNGDGKPDITYRFQFRTIVRHPATFLYNTGQVTGANDGDQNVIQRYSVTRIKNGHSTMHRHEHPGRAGQCRSPLGSERCPHVRRDPQRWVAGSRSSPASAMTRSSSTSGRSSTWAACARSTRRISSPGPPRQASTT